jgi:hypothetical protein
VEGEEAAPEPPEEEGNRAVENAVMLGFLVVLVAAGIWLLWTMADLRKVQDWCGPRSPQLHNDRNSGPGAIDAFSETGEAR